MNQTGVASTGSRRQARRKRSFTHYPFVKAERRRREVESSGVKRSGEGHEIVQPQKLATHRGVQRVDLCGRAGIVKVIAHHGDDRILLVVGAFRRCCGNCRPLRMGILGPRLIAWGCSLTANLRPSGGGAL